MQHQSNAASRRTPPPDVVRVPPAVPSTFPLAQSPNPNFLIIGLFVLRLTKQLIDGLDSYLGRDADIAWLVNFLAPYPLEFALAKISGPRMEDYIAVYQMIISRMKSQPRYPLRFMQINPDRPMQQQQASRQVGGEEFRKMTDNIIDFCDAAGEWGSTVPMPAREAKRMIEIANQRRIADLDERRPLRDDRHVYQGYH